MPSPDPGSLACPVRPLVRKGIDLHGQVAVDAETAVLVAGGALCPAGAELDSVLELEPGGMSAWQKVIPLVTFLAVIALVADFTGGPVVHPGVISMLVLPYRQYMVGWNFASRVIVTDNAILCLLDAVMAGSAKGHAGDMP